MVSCGCRPFAKQKYTIDIVKKAISRAITGVVITMELLGKIREGRRDALLRKDRIKLSILSTALGEIENAKARGGWKDGDEKRVIKKLIESNKDTIDVSSSKDYGDPNQIDNLKYEIEVLKDLLPKELSFDELASQLVIVSADILGAGSVDKGMGAAMKFVREKRLNTDGKMVKKFVEKIFGSKG